MNESVRLLFRLVRAGLNMPEPAGRPGAGIGSEPAGRPVENSSSGPFSEVGSGRIDWAAVYALASEQGVLAIAWDGLRRLADEGRVPEEQLPDKRLKLRWAYNVERMEQTYARQREAIGKLGAFYAGHGIRMMLLKGYGLSLNYPVPSHRPCGDIDIWLYGRQREADELLHEHTGIDIDEDKHHHTVFHIAGVMVENHYDFLNVHAHPSNREIESSLQAYAAQPGGTTTVNGTTLCLPSADFNALFLLRHAAAHFAAIDIGLRHVVDWALFVQRYHDTIDWTQLERIARKQNMHRFLHCMNALAIDALGIAPDCFPPFERDTALEQRVLNDILHPEFDEQPPHGNIIKGLAFKFRRWWANRWKHRIVYREGLLRTFFAQLRSHLMKPQSLK